MKAIKFVLKGRVKINCESVVDVTTGILAKAMLENPGIITSKRVDIEWESDLE